MSAGEVSSTARAIPKSMTFTWRSGVTITFAGLMSRWTIPARWLYSRASRIPRVMSTASRGVTASSWISSRKVRPGTYSITMNGRSTPSSVRARISPVSYTETIEWWLRAATDCASRLKRSWKVASRASSGRSTLIATRRPSRRSRPTWTVAIPPRPIVSPTS
ncbi:hypothetical protein BJF77_09205 [Kocuria sp. CNJ-770]|nr:hypothetical protein BJF77_09205 [Kocuria sp. CNJ-770]